MTRVVVMQPYFFPYLGYFRLFAASDLFVFLDCVQFPRRGYVHRNQAPAAHPSARNAGEPKWLTLPLARQPRETLIHDLRFAPDAADEWSRRLAGFDWLSKSPPQNDAIVAALRDVRNDADVCDYLIATLLSSTDRLGLDYRWIRSSSLQVPSEFRGQDRIIEIVKRCGGRTYVNAPGGVGLYDAEAFRREGMALEFLPPFSGSPHSVLYGFWFSSDEEMRAQLKG